MNELEQRALEYIRNTDGNCPVFEFDEDHEPIGPLLRAELVPRYVTVNPIDQQMSLTAEGEARIT